MQMVSRGIQHCFWALLYFWGSAYGSISESSKGVWFCFLSWYQGKITMFPGSFGPDRECWQLIYIIRSVLGYILIAIPGNSEIPFRSCDHNRSSIQLVAMLVCWTQSSYTLLQSTCELSLTIYTNFSRASTLPSLRLTTTWFIVNIIRSWSKGLPSCCLPNSWGCVDFYSSSTLVSHISNLLRPSKINKHGLFFAWLEEYIESTRYLKLSKYVHYIEKIFTSHRSLRVQKDWTAREEWERELKQLNKDLWVNRRERYQHEQTKPDGLAIPDSDENILDIESDEARRGCAAMGGCYARDCGCCSRPRNMDRRPRHSHCTIECGCCIQNRGSIDQK